MWGGNQHQVLHNFAIGLQNDTNLENFENTILEITSSLEEGDDEEDHVSPFEQARLLPGLGCTYTSKFIRFYRPDKYGALDSHIINAWDLPANSNGYHQFIKVLSEKYKPYLEENQIYRPEYANRSATNEWRVAEIEMAIFSWAQNSTF